MLFNRPEIVFADCMKNEHLNTKELELAFKWFLLGWTGGLEHAIEVQGQIHKGGKVTEVVEHDVSPPHVAGISGRYKVARSWSPQRRAKFEKMKAKKSK